jgi:predicted DNA-binding transcriptional regulator YafY
LFEHDVLLCGVNIKAKQPAYQNLMRKPRTLGHTMKDIDRLYRYKSLLTSRHAVSSDELMAVLGISIATLKRDMANLRERLNIPVEYDRSLGGYRLIPGHGRKELPGLWLTPDELVALATLQHLLSGFAPGVLADKLGPLKERLAHLLHDVDVDSARLGERIRLVHAGQRRLPPAAFEAVATATLGRLRLNLTHHNRETNQTIERTVSPQQLVHYRDNWYLDAWCHLRNGFRSFAVDAMTAARVLPDEPAYEMDADTLRRATQASYGIFSGEPVGLAVLRFSAERARWVSGEQWHPEQVSQWLPDGSYRLTLPYSDDRELLGDILRHGAHCVVESPPSLRDKTLEALQAACAAYVG